MKKIAFLFFGIGFLFLPVGVKAYTRDPATPIAIPVNSFIDGSDVWGLCSGVISGGHEAQYIIPQLTDGTSFTPPSAVDRSPIYYATGQDLSWEANFTFSGQEPFMNDNGKNAPFIDYNTTGLSILVLWRDGSVYTWSRCPGVISDVFCFGSSCGGSGGGSVSSPVDAFLTANNASSSNAVLKLGSNFWDLFSSNGVLIFCGLLAFAIAIFPYKKLKNILK